MIVAIKNKDGSTYRLTYPNPIILLQDFWDKSKVILHNKVGVHFTVTSEEMATKPPVKESIPIVQSLEEPDQVGDVAEDTITCWCLPAIYQKFEDPLYNEEYRKVTYGEKFLFEAICVDQTDFNLVLWTNTKTVTESSVLFPRTYDKRWWRVVKTEPDPQGGILLSCTMSDYHPHFSD